MVLTSSLYEEMTAILHVISFTEL